MFTSIIARTFSLARGAWARTIGAFLIAGIFGAIVIVGAAFLGEALLGRAPEALAFGDATPADTGRLLTLGLPIALVVIATYAWLQLVPIRAVTGKHGFADSLLGARAGAWRMLPLYVLVIAVELLLIAVDQTGLLLLLAIVVFSVPLMAAVGQLAIEPGRWGMGVLWRRGVLRMHRNIGAYLAVLVVIVLTAVLAAVLYVVPLMALAGMPTSEAFTDTEALTRWIEGALIAVLVGTVIAIIPAIVLPSALVVSVYEALSGEMFRPGWDDDEEDEPSYTPNGQELSATVQQLVGAAPQVQRRLVLPPRAAVAGRVPGPGVLDVAGVDLPTGRATRSVEAATLELAVGDGAPGVTTHDEQLWVSRDALPGWSTLWKRLAAGFSETGLWPIALQLPTGMATVDWFEHSTRRESDTIDEDHPVAELLRARLAESLSGGSPLRSTDLLASSQVAGGVLPTATGRRTDALRFAFDEIGPARLALAPARRPGDVLHAVAWPGAAAAGMPTDELAELVASWETRYAALLVGVGDASLVFAVLQPPSTVDEAVELVAEQHALCPDEAADWGDDRSAAQQLMNAPTWRLSWH